MADGRYTARITTVSSRRRLVTIDVIQLFLGKAATTAAAQDHISEVPPPNDVWIRNVATGCAPCPSRPRRRSR